MIHTKRDYRIGLYCVLLSTCCYGFMPVFTQLAFRSGMPTLTVMFGRFGLALILYILHMKYRGVRLKVSRKQFLFLMVLGVSGTISTFGMNESYRYLPSGVATVMTMMYIAVIVVCEMIIGREPVAVYRLVCLALAFSGIVLIVLSPGESGVSPFGVFLGLVGAVFYGIQVMAINHTLIRGLNPEVIFIYETIPLLICCAALGAAKGVPLLPADAGQLGHVLLLAVFNSFIAMIAFYTAVRLIGASSASLFGTAEPLVSCAAGVLIMGDVLTAGNLCGGLLIVTAILCLNLFEKKKTSLSLQGEGCENNEPAAENAGTDQNKRKENVDFHE